MARYAVHHATMVVGNVFIKRLKRCLRPIKLATRTGDLPDVAVEPGAGWVVGIDAVQCNGLINGEHGCGPPAWRHLPVLLRRRGRWNTTWRRLNWFGRRAVSNTMIGDVVGNRGRLLLPVGTHQSQRLPRILDIPNRKNWLIRPHALKINLPVLEVVAGDQIHKNTRIKRRQMGAQLIHTATFIGIVTFLAVGQAKLPRRQHPFALHKRRIHRQWRHREFVGVMYLARCLRHRLLLNKRLSHGKFPAF